MERADDYKSRRAYLKNLTESELEGLFWKLTEKLTEPLIDLAKTHTTPSIERSVLLRMGFSSLEADSIVNKVLEHNLISKGAGHVVYRAAREEGIGIRDAGLRLGAGELWEKVLPLFAAGAGGAAEVQPKRG